MVGKLKYIVFVMFAISVQTYGQQLISYVSLNHDTAYIGQPVQMTVSVYSNTWFTTGIDVGNIQVEGALTVYFRSVSNSRTFSGKQFSGVDFIYNVFPTRAGKITVPELTIHVESPKPGGYKGIKHTIHTKPKSIQVNDVPVGYDPNNWLVSSSLNITERWNTSLKNVKVGDVLQRTITRSAAGTLSEFIPAVTWDSVPGVSIYNTRPKTNTHKSKTAVSASRVEMANYLFEKEGEVVLPKIEFVYWNYYNKRFYKKTIDSTVIQVAPNADLEMLASIKKQLEAETTEPEVAEDKPFLILGMTPKRFLLLVIFGLLAIYVLIKLLKWFIPFSKKKYQAYLHSEKYLFTKVTRALRQKNARGFLEQLTKWMLHLDLEEQSFDYFLKTYGTEDLKREYSQLMANLFQNERPALSNSSALLSALKASRKQYFETLEEKSKAKLDTDWLNPTG
ncbi:BatD family protein [Xanthomarina sp. F1114]|uniref:BatD family protein n=1 Tax=Xanthomarina sp. F1114 TaxID=2996019 RepID=UPI00225E1C66|nr:BatD family protein [Xanthomarina sp. F1114]MCX7546642.1 BatD family protein [Xanthomarina sp. F1114]